LFIKVLALDAFQISFYRSAFAAITIFIVLKANKQSIKFEFDRLSILCSVSYAGILIFFVIATKLTTAANAIFLQFTAPIYLLVLEPVFLKTRFEIKNLIALVFCLAGMTLFFFGKLEISDIYGNLFAIASGISFAFFSLFLKWRKKKNINSNTLVNILAGNILVSIICFPVIFPELSLETSQLMILLYMGVFQIGLSYVIFNEGVKYVSATEAMIIAMLETIFNPVWVFIGIREVPGIYAIFGGIIILTAIVWRSFYNKPAIKLPLAG
jgi:DME family drug/metabolite transporter